jgi:glycosyltransferase involved in cell wall biosynthesis
MTSVRIAVILCTYNRCQDLGRALESIASSIVPEELEWDVLVVDNNSNDQTREVVEKYRQLYPGRFRYLFEPKPGKSSALNAGIRASRANILAFMDDDVLVEPTWLANLTAPLLSGQWAGTGGRILSQEMIEVPSWLSIDGPQSLGGMLALFDLGDSPGELDRPPFGTNMAFIKTIFDKYGDFRTDMGPCPGSEIRNEDTEFGRRLMSAGERLWYVPGAVVYHAVPENRLKKEYFLRFWYDHGRARFREKPSRPHVMGVPRSYFTFLKTVGVLLPARAMRWFTSFNPKRRFYFKGRVWSTLGQIEEFRSQRSTRKAGGSADLDGRSGPQTQT